VVTVEFVPWVTLVGIVSLVIARTAAVTASFILTLAALVATIGMEQNVMYVQRVMLETTASIRM
jgi:hypothetical protein